MSGSTVAPEDSVLRRHFESARQFAAQAQIQTVSSASGIPEDSVLRRHHESAKRLSQSDVSPSRAAKTNQKTSPANHPDDAKRPRASDPLAASHGPGPSPLRPAHIDITQKRSGSGLLGTLRRLLGG